VTFLAALAAALAGASLAAACATGTPPEGGGDGGGGGGGPDAATPADAAPQADADTCEADPCSLLEQCGCGATQVCDLDGAALATGGTECRDVTAPGTDLASCASSTECAGGYVCLGSPGQCRRYCDSAGGEPSCDEGGHCILQVVYDPGGGALEPVPGAVTCTKPCAPEKASDNGCPSDPQFGCRFFRYDPDQTPDSGDEIHVTDCAGAPAPGTAGNEAACEFSSDCAPGYACVTFSGGDNPRTVCKQTCVYAVGGVAGPRGCAAGTCQQYAEPRPIVGTTEYGRCN